QDLQVQRDRFGVERRHGHRRELLADVLDSDLTGSELPLEGVPRERVAEYVYRVEQQKTPVRLVQRAGLDHAEVGDHGAEEGAVLDATEQIVVGGIRLEYYRRACCPRTILDQNVHGIAIPDGFMIELGHDRFKRNVASLPRFF